MVEWMERREEEEGGDEERMIKRMDGCESVGFVK